MTPELRAQARPGLRVVKLGYSVNPWRIVGDDDRELWRDEVIEHPFLGKTVCSMPVSFPRKRDAAAWLAAQADPVDLPSPDSNGEPPPTPLPGEPEVPE